MGTVALQRTNNYCWRVMVLLLLTASHCCQGCETNPAYAINLPYSYKNTLCWRPGLDVTQLAVPGNKPEEVNPTHLQHWHRIDVDVQTHQEPTCGDDTLVRLTLNISTLGIWRDYCFAGESKRLSISSDGKSDWGKDCENLPCGNETATATTTATTATTTATAAPTPPPKDSDNWVTPTVVALVVVVLALVVLAVSGGFLILRYLQKKTQAGTNLTQKAPETMNLSPTGYFSQWGSARGSDDHIYETIDPPLPSTAHPGNRHAAQETLRATPTKFEGYRSSSLHVSENSLYESLDQAKVLTAHSDKQTSRETVGVTETQIHRPSSPCDSKNSLYVPCDNALPVQPPPVHGNDQPECGNKPLVHSTEKPAVENNESVYVDMGGFLNSH